MISILLATCGRPVLLREMLRSLRGTTKEHEVEIIAVVDKDKESKKILELYDVDVIDWSPDRRGALWAWNRALFLSDGAYLVPAGDDQLFYSGWLEYALESHRTKLDNYGVVGMNDLAYDGNVQVATMFLFDRLYCKDVMGGIFAPPSYRYYSVDREWNEKAKMLGHFYWDERAKVEHIHSAHNKRPVDDIDESKGGELAMAEDNEVFEARKRYGFPVIWQPLI